MAEVLKVEVSKVLVGRKVKVTTFKARNQLDLTRTSSQTVIRQLTRRRHWRYINSV